MNSWSLNPASNTCLRNTDSAVGERQMLPMQTKSTPIWVSAGPFNRFHTIELSPYVTTGILNSPRLSSHISRKQSQINRREDTSGHQHDFPLAQLARYLAVPTASRQKGG